MVRNRRERWYSLDGQNQSRYQASHASSGMRKIVSLIVLLALVLILIRQISDPKKVEQVATAIGLFPRQGEDPTVERKSDGSQDDFKTGPLLSTPGLNSDSKDNSDVIPVNLSKDVIYETVSLQSESDEVEQYSKVLDALLNLAPATCVQQIARITFASVPETNTSSSPSSDEIQAWLTVANEQIAKWKRIESENPPSNVGGQVQPENILDRFEPLFAEWGQKGFDEGNASGGLDAGGLEAVQDMQFRRALHLALDRKLLAIVEDNSPWKANERLPFLRSWQRVEVLRNALATNLTGPKQLPKAEIAQMMSVAASLRSKPIRFYGTVARVDKSDQIQEPGFGKLAYEIFWLRPDDSNQQPVKVYVPKDNIDKSTVLAERTPVMICGFFFKRFAYAAERGPEVAPMLMAAYVGPKTASASGDAKELLQFSGLPKGDRLQNWSPPIDYSTQLELVKQLLTPYLNDLVQTKIQRDWESTNAKSTFMRPLPTVVKLTPEINFLSMFGKRWEIDERSFIGRVSGTITSIEKISLSPELTSVLESETAYRCRLESEQADQTTEVTNIFCNSLPKAWLSSDGVPMVDLLQPCSISGFVLASKDAEPDFMWTGAFQWITEPDGRSSSTSILNNNKWNPPVQEPHLFLMNHQWNLAWLDLIRGLQADPVKPLSQIEHEPFFSLIRLAKNTPFAEGVPDKSSPKLTQSIADLLEKLRSSKNSKNVNSISDESSGRTSLERVAMEARVVRISFVPIEDPTQVRLLGQNFYYQLDVMADVGNRSYEIKTEKEPIIHHKEYPVTCVVAELPDWLLDSNSEANITSGKNDSGNLERVWYPRKKVNMEGWFYRFWRYKTEETSLVLGERGRQIGPLVVLDSIQRFRSEPETPSTNFLTSSSFSMLISVLGIGAIWWYVRSRLVQKPKMKFKQSMKESD